jgi:hypothetical protein
MQSVRTLENLEHLKTLAGPRDGRLCTFCRTLRTSSYMYSRFQQGCGFRMGLARYGVQIRAFMSRVTVD